MARKYKRRYGSYGPLKAKRPKNRYKTIDNYLKSVYKNNKEFLDSHIKDFGKASKKNIFVEAVKSRLNKINPETGKKYTVKQAIEKVQRSTLITTREERIAETRITRMREMDPEKFKDLRKAIGWTNKIKSENFIEMLHDGNKNYLRYKDEATGKDIILIETISPKTGITTEYEVQDYFSWRYKYLKDHASESPELYAEWTKVRNMVENVVKKNLK